MPCSFVEEDRVVEGGVSLLGLAGMAVHVIFYKIYKIKGKQSDGWIKSISATKWLFEILVMNFS